MEKCIFVFPYIYRKIQFDCLSEFLLMAKGFKGRWQQEVDPEELG
ncbi:hypothetical protein J2W59_002029 [Pseudomonas fluorescens]|jgi:hypothetical protein|nr:hypothetical protein [Pseudomonas fluorescens]